MNNPLRVATAIAVFLLSVVLTSQAAPVTFFVDPNQTILTLNGSAFDLPFSAQPSHAGSLQDRWAGSITADLSGGVLTFHGGSSITALLNTPALPPFSTLPYSVVPADSIDNYGVFASGIVNGLALELNGAYRTLTLDITTGTATSGSVASGMTFQFTSGHLEWGALVPPDTPVDGGSSSLVGVTGANTASGVVSLTSEGVLTIPIQLSTTGANRTEQWNGVIVATVPEPSIISLLLVGVAALCVKNARARRP